MKRLAFVTCLLSPLPTLAAQASSHHRSDHIPGPRAGHHPDRRQTGRGSRGQDRAAGRAGRVGGWRDPGQPRLAGLARAELRAGKSHDRQPGSPGHPRPALRDRARVHGEADAQRGALGLPGGHAGRDRAFCPGRGCGHVAAARARRDGARFPGRHPVRNQRRDHRARAQGSGALAESRSAHHSGRGV